MNVAWKESKPSLPPFHILFLNKANHMFATLPRTARWSPLSEIIDVFLVESLTTSTPISEMEQGGFVFRKQQFDLWFTTCRSKHFSICFFAKRIWHQHWFTFTSECRLFSPNISHRKVRSSWLSTCGCSWAGRAASSSYRPIKWK